MDILDRRFPLLGLMAKVVITLNDLSVGDEGKVLGLDLEAEDARRLMEMGLTVGAKIKVLKLAPLGDPIEIVLRGYHLSLRKSQAAKIVVGPISSSP